MRLYIWHVLRKDMPHINVRYVRLDKLRATPGYTIVVRLIMALNDLASIEEFMRYLRTRVPETVGLKKVVDGAQYDKLLQPAMQGHVRYVIRMQIGHLTEARRVLLDLGESQALESALLWFNHRNPELWDSVREAFSTADFDRRIASVRGQLGFHYNHENGSRLIDRALERRTEPFRWETSWSTVQMSLDQPYMRLGVGDDVFDSALAHLLDVAVGDAFHEELFDALGYHIELAHVFARFALRFIDFFFEEKGLYR